MFIEFTQIFPVLESKKIVIHIDEIKSIFKTEMDETNVSLKNGVSITVKQTYEEIKYLLETNNLLATC